MSDKKILQENGTEQKSSTSNVHKRVFSTLLALGVCLVLALFVWIVVMNSEGSDYVTVRLPEKDGVIYELSASEVKVEAAMVQLKQLEYIELSLPEAAANATKGTFSLTEADLILPEGVRLAGQWNATLTVAEK